MVLSIMSFLSGLAIFDFETLFTTLFACDAGFDVVTSPFDPSELFT